MFEYLSTSEYGLKSIPGVVVKLRKMSHGRRMQLNLEAASVFSELGELQKQLEPVEDDIKRAEEAASLEPCSCDHLPGVHEETTGRCTIASCQCRVPRPSEDVGGYDKRTELQGKFAELLIYKLYPIYIKWGVKELQGLKIDGAPATVESFIQEMPEGVISELGAEIQRMTRLSMDETLGFKRLSTSAVAVGEQPMGTAPSNAASASVESSTKQDIADAISPI